MSCSRSGLISLNRPASASDNAIPCAGTNPPARFLRTSSMEIPCLSASSVSTSRVSDLFCFLLVAVFADLSCSLAVSESFAVSGSLRVSVVSAAVASVFVSGCSVTSVTSTVPCCSIVSVASAFFESLLTPVLRLTLFRCLLLSVPILPLFRNFL